MNTFFRKRVSANAYERGMTLAEILVVVAIIGLLSISIATFQKNVITYGSTVSAGLSSAQDARAMIRTITKELRSATTGSNGSYPLAQAGTSSITFFADTNADGIKEQI
ncbi:prepilin-type N-terminal cleavage/methylation domain-containing protein, partial [bacterium]|nr:prepilin-type N-terminal cleavage/methylation domain-containing protein [bacterium]